MVAVLKESKAISQDFNRLMHPGVQIKLGPSSNNEEATKKIQECFLII